jgi:hypothetical protein
LKENLTQNDKAFGVNLLAIYRIEKHNKQRSSLFGIINTLSIYRYGRDEAGDIPLKMASSCERSISKG